MHEPLVERIAQLERSVRRWRLACFALAIIVISLLAIGGTVGTMVLLQLPEIGELEMQRAEAQAMRDQAQQAQMRAEEAVQAQRAVRQQLEAQQKGP